MKKYKIYSLTVLFLLAYGNELSAQERQRQSIRTSASEINIGELANDELQLLYPEKIKGVIYYSADDIEKYEMNYNILLDEIHLIARRGKTHALQTNPPFEKIVLGDKIFVYDNQIGYLEHLRSGKTNLYLKRKINVATMPVSRGAYGTTDHTSSIDMTTIEQPGAPYHVSEARVNNPEAQEMDITIRYNEYFYFEADGEKIRISNRRQLLREFREYRSELRSFIRENDIEFNDTEDMIKIAKYIESLSD